MQCCVVVSQSRLSCHMCRMVLWSRLQSSCHVRCRGCSHCATFGVAVAVIVPRSVSRLQLSCHVRCRGRSLCAAFGVTGTVVVPCLVLRLPSSCRTWCRVHCHRAMFNVAVAVVAPHVVSWSWWVSLSCMVSQSHSLRGCSGCCCAVVALHSVAVMAVAPCGVVEL